MGVQLYTVLTEFKFEVGNAIVNSGKVQEAIDGISHSADKAMNSMKSLGLGIVANFGLGATSVIGILGQAVKASDNFNKSQLVFANIISSNLNVLTGDIGNFNDRMAVSGQILKDIAADAKKFGLPEQDLAMMTKSMAPMLVPKGLAGDNFSEARNLSRNFLKSAPTLGVDTMESQGQLMRMIGDKTGGQASMGDTLFRRLTAETAAFRDGLSGAANAAKKFNSLPLEKRFQMIQEGMNQFANDADVLAGNALTISSMLGRLRDMFVGFDGVLRPLGDSIMPIIQQAFVIFSGVIESLMPVIKRFAGFIKIFTKDIEQAYLNLNQLRSLGSDFKAAGSTLGIGVFIQFLAHFGLLGVIFKVLLIPLGFMLKAFTFLAPVFGILGKVFIFLGAAAAKFFVALLPLLWVFQTLSRAKAIGEKNDLKKMPEMTNKMSVLGEKWAKLTDTFFGGIYRAIDSIAHSISWIFEWSYWLDFGISVLDGLTTAFTYLTSILAGLQWMIMSFVKDMMSLNFKGSGGRALDSFKEGFNTNFDRINKSSLDEQGGKKVSNMTTNIGKVEINNAFKEQMEPDRIAFTLKDQLLKTAINPTQAKGRALRALPIGN